MLNILSHGLTLGKFLHSRDMKIAQDRRFMNMQQSTRTSRVLGLVRHLIVLLILLGVVITTNESKAQVYCATNLGNLSPSTTWQTTFHSCLGHFSFTATAGCQYEFTYCSNGGSYSGDPYLTISTAPTSGAVANNDDFCSLGSRLLWTAPSSGVYYLNVGNCCSPSCTCGVSRTLAY